MNLPPGLPFADLVRDRMKERGMGLRELCRAVGVDPSYFSKVLAHKRNPPSEEEVLEKIASALEIDATRLVVSAGRIPRNWQSIWSDCALFQKVHGLLAGTGSYSGLSPTASGSGTSPRKGSVARRTGGGWGRPTPRPYVRKDLDEELL